jgi:hypothetical protein
MESQHDPTVKAIIAEAADHCDIRWIGEFEEPEWVVRGSERWTARRSGAGPVEKDDQRT